MKHYSEQVACLVDVDDVDAVVAEIRTISAMLFPRYDYSAFEKAWRDVDRLFRGEFPGYRESNVEYHDLCHTMAVTLAVARLMHGAVEAGHSLTEKDYTIGLVCALTHDAGYIQNSDDHQGTGAKYTLVHISRSIEFIENYYRDDHWFKGDIQSMKDILNCTGLNTKIREISFVDENRELLGKILGTGDLLGQMADRCYLEKLLHLYDEFVEGGVTMFTSPLDLLEKTSGFYEMTKKRLSEELGNTVRFGRYHFRARWSVDEDLYMKAIENNLSYLDYVLRRHRDEYEMCLRRTVKEPLPEYQYERSVQGRVG